MIPDDPPVHDTQSNSLGHVLLDAIALLYRAIDDGATPWDDYSFSEAEYWEVLARADQLAGQSVMYGRELGLLE